MPNNETDLDQDINVITNIKCAVMWKCPMMFHRLTIYHNLQFYKLVSLKKIILSRTNFVAISYCLYYILMQVKLYILLDCWLQYVTEF